MKPPFPYYGGKTRPSAVDHRAAPAARDLPKSWSEQSAGLAKPWDGKGAKP